MLRTVTVTDKNTIETLDATGACTLILSSSQLLEWKQYEKEIFQLSHRRNPTESFTCYTVKIVAFQKLEKGTAVILVLEGVDRPRRKF